jgi:NAD(P)-dependent dehydrogenase (short-subunit alcohol dehydrogenase family)
VEPPTTIAGPPGRLDRALEASVVGSFTRIGIGVRRRIEHWEDPEGSGRRVLVTGGNSGLGFATARSLLLRGARVLITTRDEDRGAEAGRALVESVASAGGDRDEIASRLETAVLDLDQLSSVRALAARQHLLADVDVVVHNAGAMFPTRTVTGDDLEHTYQVHVVAPFLLTMLLVPRLATRPDPRVVWVASGGMYTEPLVVRRVDSPGGYRPSVAYARAKRAQVELAAELHRRLGERTGIAFHAMHPGWARTPGLASSLPGFTRLVGPLLRSPTDGADTIVHLALAPRRSAAMSGGAFWHDRRPRTTDRLRRTITTDAERAALWERLMVDAGIDRPAGLH